MIRVTGSKCNPSLNQLVGISMAASVMAFRSFFLMVLVAMAIGLLATGGTAENHLLSGDKLKTGDNLSDINYSLRMQPDCNLVLNQINPEKAIWNTQTDKKGIGCELTLQTDGNLVIHDENQNVIWESKTNGTSGNYVLLLQRDRNLVLYKNPIWDSGTGTKI